AFSKYYVQGTKLSILPLNPSRGVNSKGLKYELTNAQLSPTKQTSSSNEVQSNGVVELTVNSGCLLLIESVD
ncbi:MAG: thiamine pyrophosphokinase, partial [Bacteroidia bacterium]